MKIPTMPGCSPRRATSMVSSSYPLMCSTGRAKIVSPCPATVSLCAALLTRHFAFSLATWADSFTKLLAFNQTQYDRVLSIDSDVLLLQHMDELFLIPPVPVAMPRAYWLWPDEQILSSQVILLEPSELEFGRIMVKVQEADRNDYDMEIVNYLYRDSALVLPHRPYDLVTGEFRADDHKYYLGSDVEPWDPAAAYNEAKLVHFSDWPLPKPWLHLSEPTMMEMQPKCVDAADGSEDCTGRLIWNGFYSDFRKLRNVRSLVLYFISVMLIKVTGRVRKCAKA